MRSLPHGYEIRPPTSGDVDGVTDMLLASDLADTGVSGSDADVIRDQWSSPGFEPSEDAWVVTDPSGTVVGYERVGMHTARAWDLYEKPVA